MSNVVTVLCEYMRWYKEAIYLTRDIEVPFIYHLHFCEKLDEIKLKG